MQRLILLIISLCIFVNLNAQDNIQSASEILGEDVLSLMRYLDEDRAVKQSKILSYDDLSGTFWVMAEPIMEDGIRHFFYGYVFLDNNCMIEVQVEHSPTIDILEAVSILPVLYISFIRDAMTYKIVDGKIIFEDEFTRYIECYLEDTYLYLCNSIGYRKYRLQQQFSIYPWGRDAEVTATNFEEMR